MPQTDLPEAGPGPDSPKTTLVPFSFWTNGTGASVPRLSAAMAEQFLALGLRQAEPLRWAITAVDPQRGLQLEGIVVAAAPPAAESTGQPSASPDAEPEPA